MLVSAWGAAIKLINSKGNLVEDPNVAEKKFLKRKSCSGLPSEDCLDAFRNSLEVAQAVRHFQYTRCGINPPKASRRYELLHTLAKELEIEFPSTDQLTILAGCSLLELEWDR